MITLAAIFASNTALFAVINGSRCCDCLDLHELKHLSYRLIHILNIDYIEDLGPWIESLGTSPKRDGRPLSTVA